MANTDNVILTARARGHYFYWQTEDRKTLRKINKLIDDSLRNGYTGMGKPEPLTGDLSGLWSREIDDKNRFVYKIMPNGYLYISQCKGHYNDK